MRGKQIIATHHTPDLDAIAAIFLMLKLYGDKKQKESVAIFLRGGDEALLEFAGITLIDRGKGQFDHHGKKGKPETSTSLVAKKLGIVKEKTIQRLLRAVERSDLQGISLPFDASDVIKCMQRLEIKNEEIVEMGIRIVNDCLEFSKFKFQRENLKVKKIIEDFLLSKEIIPPKFQEYILRLGNERFERPFDIVEVFSTESKNNGEEIAVDFIKKLLQFEYKDSLNYLKALSEVKKAWKINVRGYVIVADYSDNPRFKDAARNDQKALITIQRKTNGQTGIYFDTKRTNDSLAEAFVSMIRLEECLIQGREIPKTDLRKPELVEGIPEWYFFKAPEIPGKKKKPGRFIFNGSITAPDIPQSKIPMAVLRDIAIKAIIYQPFNWVRWQAERLAYYANKKAA